MRRVALALAVAAALALSACSGPNNGPCYWHQNVQRSHMSRDGHTLVVICGDGTIHVIHP